MYTLQTLDTPSIALLIFMIATVLAAGMTILWRMDATEKGFGFWVAAQWALALGMLFLFSRALLPLWVSVGLGNGFLMLMPVLIRLGIARFRELNLSIWPETLVIGGVTVAITLNAAADGSIETRIALVCGALVLGGVRVVAALHGVTGSVRTVARAIQGVMLFLGAMLASRGIVAVFRDPSTGSVFEAGVASATLFISVAVSTVALPFILVVMSSVRTRELIMRARVAAEHASETDLLTGLPNRRGLFRQVADKTPTQRLGVCLIDLDKFKTVNDNYGHDRGDRVLTELAGLLNEVAPECTHARLGGEEFVTLVPGGDRQTTLDTAERLRAAIQDQLAARSGVDHPITTSIGASCGPASRFRELLTTADLSLYRAKHAGRNRVLGAGPGENDRTPSGRMVRYRSANDSR